MHGYVSREKAHFLLKAIASPPLETKRGPRAMAIVRADSVPRILVH